MPNQFLTNYTDVTFLEKIKDNLRHCTAFHFSVSFIKKAGLGSLFSVVIHEYPDLIVRLSVYNATIFSGIPQVLEHNDIQWITIADAANYTFCPADEPIIKKLSELSQPC